MSRRDKGQISVEFITLTGLVLLIFLALLAIGTSQRASVRAMDVQIRQREICNQLAVAADTAYNVGPGFWYRVILPMQIREDNYTVTSEEGTIGVTSHGVTTFCRTFTDSINITGVAGGTVTVRNEDGTITIS